MQPKENDELTSSARRIFALALPVGLETVFQTSLGAVDQVIVAFLGADAIAGVGLSNTVTFIVMLVYSAIVRGLRTTGREQRRKHGNIPFTQ